MAGEKEHGPMFIIVLVSVTTAIFAYAIWYAFKYDIMNGLKYLCLAELYIIDVFVNNPELGETKELLLSLTKTELNIPDIIAPAIFLVSSYARYVFAPILVTFIYSSFMHPAKKMFRYKMNLDAMIKRQSKVWPYSAPFVTYDPGRESSRVDGTTVPKKLAIFAEALSPAEWVVFHDIEMEDDNYKFDEHKASQVFKSQLGKRWRGTASLSEHNRALFAAFALKGARKREESDELLGDLSRCWTRKKGFVLTRKLRKRIATILRDPKIGHEAVKVANEHAYVSSAMLGVLAWARTRGGVLAPAQFVWLRGADRNLWYALNSLGRRTYFSEGSGAMAHYYIEKGIDKPMVTINIDNAIDALKEFFEEHYPKIPTKE